MCHKTKPKVMNLGKITVEKRLESDRKQIREGRVRSNQNVSYMCIVKNQM